MSTIRETVSTSSPASGASRSGGILISFITAIVVFAIGQAIVSHFRGSTTVAEEVAAPPPPKVAPPTPPPVAPVAATAPAAAAAGTNDPAAPAAVDPTAPVAGAAEPGAGAKPSVAALPAPGPAPAAAAGTPPATPSPTAKPAPPTAEKPALAMADKPAASLADKPVGRPAIAPAGESAGAVANDSATKAPAAAARAGADLPPTAPPETTAATTNPARKLTKTTVGPKPEAAVAAPSEEPSAPSADVASGTAAKPAVATKAKTAAAAAGSIKTPAAGTAITVAGAAPAPTEGPPAAKDPAGAAAPGATAAGDKPSDKDIAREAWRRNLPDISSSEETKASILIPIKGSIEGATYHVNTKPKSVVVNLPKADALITMRFYKIKREGFRNLWILKQEEGEGTTVKLMLGEATAPQVEIKDDYIRINVRKPADLPPEE